MKSGIGWIWVFSGEGGRFPSAVFSTKEVALDWIRGRRLSGTLTAYPVDEPVYEWAIREGLFFPKSDKHRSPQFIQGFSSGNQEHYHFTDGVGGGE